MTSFVTRMLSRLIYVRAQTLFPLFATVNNAALNIQVQALMWISVVAALGLDCGVPVC